MPTEQEASAPLVAQDVMPAEQEVTLPAQQDAAAPAEQAVPVEEAGAPVVEQEIDAPVEQEADAPAEEEIDAVAHVKQEAEAPAEEETAEPDDVSPAVESFVESAVDQAVSSFEATLLPEEPAAPAASDGVRSQASKIPLASGASSFVGWEIPPELFTPRMPREDAGEAADALSQGETADLEDACTDSAVYFEELATFDRAFDAPDR